LPEYAQRGLPIPVRFGGKTYNVSVAPPATDLNQLTADPVGQAQNIAQRLTQLKMIGELMANYSVFFRGPIERDDQKLVPAPSVVGNLPGFVKKKLGVQEYNDPRRGRILGWWGKTDYVFRQLPETNLLTSVLTPVPGSRQMNKTTAIVGAATGAKVTPYKETVEDERISRLGKKLKTLRDQSELMRDKGTHATPAGTATRQYRKVLDDIQSLTKERNALKTKRGDVIRKPLKKVRKSSEGDGFGGGGDGDGFGGGGF
jgi:hypothetical protein